MDGPPCEGSRPGTTELLSSFVAEEVAVVVTDSVEAAVVVTAPLATEVVMTDSFALNGVFVVQSALALEKCQHGGSQCTAVMLAKLQRLQSCEAMFCTIW